MKDLFRIFTTIPVFKGLPGLFICSLLFLFPSCNEGEFAQDSIPGTDEFDNTGLIKPDGDKTRIKIKYGKIRDIDGNRYVTVSIGNRWWMAENLKTTKYNDGTEIPLITTVDDWITLEGPGYGWYENDITYKDIYGAVYSWYVINDSKNVCPVGWHVSTVADWDELIEYCGGTDVAGGKLKATGTIEGGDGMWYYPNLGATNEFGFSALPGGAFVYDGDYQGTGGFKHLGQVGFWWARRSGVGSRLMHYNLSEVNLFSIFDENCGFSIRCVRD